MDPGIKLELEHQKQTRIDIVKKEMQWEQAKHQLSLNKLHSRFDFYMVYWLSLFGD